RARGRRPDPGVLHRLAQVGLLDVLAGGLHRGEERRLGVAPRRLRLLPQGFDREGLDGLALLELRQGLVAAGVVVGTLGGLSLLAVDGLPARLDQAAAARAEDVLADGRLDARALEHGLRVEDLPEALGDEAVELQPIC